MIVYSAAAASTTDPPPQSESPTSRKARTAMEQTVQEPVPHSDKDLIRTLAEVHFLNSEVCKCTKLVALPL